MDLGKVIKETSQSLGIGGALAISGPFPSLLQMRAPGPRHQRTCSGRTVRLFSFLRLVPERGGEGDSRFFQAFMVSSTRMGCRQAYRLRSPSSLEKREDSLPGTVRECSLKALGPRRAELANYPGGVDLSHFCLPLLHFLRM